MPKKVLPLTDVEIKTAKIQAKNYKLTDGNGLYLEVLSSGGKSWRFKYYFGGTEKRIVFGLWPDVSLKYARQLREQARTLIAQGIDPGEKRKQDKEIVQSQAGDRVNTFEKIARAWHTHTQKVAGWSEGHIYKVLGAMERHLFPTLGNRPIRDIHSADVLAVLRGIEAKGHNELAKNLRQYCEVVYRGAVFSNLAERNVGLELRGSLSSVRVQHRPAIIDPQEVGQLLRAIDGYEGTHVTLAAMRLLPYVFVRPGELRHMEWDEIKLDTEEPVWTIPAGKMKMRDAHIVPLARQAVTIIKDIHVHTGAGRYIFPSERTKDRPMSDNTINAALRRLGYRTDEHCGHGFRAMASTLLNELKFPRDVIERQLAHAERNNVRAAYNRAQYLTERREMMQKWANYLDELRDGKIARINNK